MCGCLYSVNSRLRSQVGQVFVGIDLQLVQVYCTELTFTIIYGCLATSESCILRHHSLVCDLLIHIIVVFCPLVLHNSLPLLAHGVLLVYSARGLTMHASNIPTQTFSQ